MTRRPRKSSKQAVGAADEAASSSIRERTGPSGWWLLLIVAVGLGLRLIYLAGIVDEPDFAQPGRDALYHDYWARAILSGDWTPPDGEADPEIRTTPYMRAPGYPWFLAGAYGLTGGSYLGARGVQVALGLVNLLLIFWVGRRLFGPRTGLAASCLAALYWSFVYYEGELHAPVLAVTLVLGVLATAGAWLRRSSIRLQGRRDLRTWPWLIAMGTCLGALCLVRPNALLVAPILALWVAWVRLKRPDHHREGVQTARLMKVVPSVALLTLATLAVVLPVAYRNAVVVDDPVLISSTGGLNLYLAHHPEADGVSSILPEVGTLAGLSGWDCFDYPRIVRAIEASEGRDMSHSEVSSYFAGKAWSFIRSRPKTTAKWALRRAALFWGPEEVSNDEVVSFDRRGSPLLSRLPGFPTALSLAILGLGLIVWGRRRQEAAGNPAPIVIDDETPSRAAVWLLVGFVGAYFLSVLPTIAAARYRVPIVPILLLLGGYAGYRVVHAVAKRQVRPAVTMMLVGLGLWGLASIPWVDYEPDLSAWHFNRAVAYQRSGNEAQAVVEYRLALEADPGHLDALSNLGAALAAQGDRAGAIELYRKALTADPFRAEAHNNLGTALADDGDFEGAIESYRQALRLRPEYAHALNNLGLALASVGRIADAEQAYRDALTIDGRYERAARNLASLLVFRGTEAIRSGESGRALAAFSEAADLAPDSFRVQADLASLLVQLGDSERLGPVLDRIEAMEIDDPGAALRLSWLLATTTGLGPDADALAVRLAQGASETEAGGLSNPAVLSTRAAALAAAGRFSEAVTDAERALEIARQAGDGQMAAALEQHLNRYRAGVSLGQQ